VSLSITFSKSGEWFTH